MSGTELCARCGEPIYHRYAGLRLCPRHAHEHLASLPPFACTSADIDAGYEPSEEAIEAAAREADARKATVTPILPRAEQ